MKSTPSVLNLRDPRASDRIHRTLLLPLPSFTVATDVMPNPKVQKEIDRFLKNHEAARVGISAGTMGRSESRIHQ